MNAHRNLALVGPTGAGKSSIGRLLAKELRRPFVDLDRCIEEQAGAEIALIFELEGEAGFRKRESAALAAALAGSGQVIACGGGIVLDAGNRQLLREQAFVVHLGVSVTQQLERLARDRSRPLLQTDDRRSRLQELAAIRDPLYTEIADLEWPACGGTAQNIATQLAQRIGMPA